MYTVYYILRHDFWIVLFYISSWLTLGLFEALRGAPCKIKLALSCAKSASRVAGTDLGGIHAAQHKVGFVPL